MAIKYKYKRTNTRGKIQYYKNINDLAASLSIQRAKARQLLVDGKRFGNYTLEELNPPFVFEMPKPGSSVNIDGVNCTVINVYNLTFSVLTDKGTRLVSVKDMSFVDDSIDKYDRNVRLAIKKF